MDTTLIDRINTQIINSNNILLIIHASPDGDSYGSNLSMYLYIKSLGKDVKVISSEKLSEKFKKIFISDSIIEYIDPADYDYSSIDLLLLLDLHKASMASRKPDFKFPSNLKTIIMDHHPNNENIPENSWVDTAYSSNCSLLFDFFKAVNFELKGDILNLLALGMLTDTAFFKTVSTKSTDLSNMAYLMDKGLDLLNISNILRIEPLYQKKFYEVIYRNLKVIKIKDLNVGYSFMTSAEAEHIGLNEEKSVPPGANYIQDLEGADMVFFLKEKKVIETNEVQYSVSLRSINPKVNLTPIGEALNGGGHKSSSGGLVKGKNKIEDAVEVVVKVITDNT